MEKKCVRVCSDEANVMTGKHSEGVAQIKEIAPDSKFVHCSIHCKALAAPLETHLTEAVKVVNLTTSRPLNSRLFSIFCSELGSEHDTLLHTKFRWLSQGSVINIMLPFISCCIK
jgi:hypothetical protein